MSISAKIEQDALCLPTARAANNALQAFAESLGLDVQALAVASSDEALGDIVDRLTTIGVNAQNASE